MRTRVVVHLLGTLLVVLGIAQLLPLICSLIYREPDAFVFLLSGSVASAVGIGFRQLGEKPRTTTVSTKESFALVTAGWFMAALLGAIPFALSATTVSFFDAFFESMSGFTTTGATILEDIETVSRGVLFWRSFTHWLGGMGIIALFVALMPHLGAGGMKLLKAEVPGPSAERITPRVAETAKLLWRIYLGLTLIQVILLLIAGLSPFDATTHTFATLATGGFSTRNASVAGLENAYAEIIIIFFMAVAGGNFALYSRVINGEWKRLFQDREYLFYIRLLGAASLIVTVALWLQGRVLSLELLRKGLFQVVSITTTTGFTTHDFDVWPHLGRLILLLLMLAGGCRGSTGGAAKQIRIMVVLKYIYRELHRTLHPRAVAPIRLGNETVPERTVASIMGFIALYITILIISSVMLTAMHVDVISAISASAACLGNIGPGLGIVGPIENYGNLPVAAKLLLSFLMLLGRLEIYTILVLFIPDFPHPRRKIIR